jgi:hypothetical protein
MFAAGADPGFVGPEAYTIIGALFKTKNTKFGTKAIIYIWPLAGRWKGPPASEGPWSLSFISFTVNQPLLDGSCSDKLVCGKSSQLNVETSTSDILPEWYAVHCCRNLRMFWGNLLNSFLGNEGGGNTFLPDFNNAVSDYTASHAGRL